MSEGTKIFKNQDQRDSLRPCPQGFYHYLIHPTHLKRFLFFLSLDFAIIVFSLYLSFFVRFEFTVSAGYRSMFFNALPFFVFIKLIMFFCFGVYKISWRYFCLNDLKKIITAQGISLLFVLCAFILFPLTNFNISRVKLASFDFPIQGFPRSVFFIDWFISLFLFLGLRGTKRLFLENIKNGERHGKKTIVIGAGNTGDMIVRDMKRQCYERYYPVGMLDDDRSKVGICMHGLKVLGTTDALSDLVSAYGIEAIIIAIPSLNHQYLRKLYAIAVNLKLEIKIVPRIYDFHKPDINIKKLEDIKIEDLIGRQAVRIDYKEIDKFLRKKTILVTGAGGSIGSEIIMQVCNFEPERVILLDIDETELHTMKQRLERSFPDFWDRHLENSRVQDKVVFIAGDVRDNDLVVEVFRKFKPQIVFHAAACKHVPMMEINPKESVKTNIFGTYTVAKASAEYRVEEFVLISTDKAVRPTSIMGTTKRMAEYICTAFNGCGNTSFLSVRFGNVLGSRGSVLPIFLEQIKHGGPVKVTHRDVQRYFMTIPEAVSLVLQSSVIGKGGDILVLDMGEPVKVLTLAEELIKIHGLKPYKDIDIEFVGLRPGEKLFEEILTAEEGTTATRHEKVFIAKNSTRYSKDEIEKILKGFEKLLKVMPITEDYEVLRDVLKMYVKSLERRSRERIHPQSEANTTAFQVCEIDFQKHRLQFEKLLKELPVIEDYEIILDTLNNYRKSLERRGRERRTQKPEPCNV